MSPAALRSSCLTVRFPIHALARVLLGGALLTTVAVAPARADSQDLAKGISLRYRAQPAPVTYKTREVTVSVDFRAGQPPKTTRAELARTLYKHMEPAPGGNLALVVETLALTELVDGQPLPSQPATPPATGEMNPRGATRMPGGRFALPTPLTMLLPDAPLPAPVQLFGQSRFGDISWTTESGPSKDVPIAVRTTHRVTGMETFQGRACVVIELTARNSEKLDDGKRFYEYFARRRVLFDPAAGLIADSSSEERVDDSVVPPPKTGLLRTHREVLGTSRLEPSN